MFDLGILGSKLLSNRNRLIIFKGYIWVEYKKRTNLIQEDGLKQSIKNFWMHFKGMVKIGIKLLRSLKIEAFYKFALTHRSSS